MNSTGIEKVKYPVIDLSSEMGSIRGEEEPIQAIGDDKLFVAVGKDVKENKSTVIWALQNSGGKKIWIIHVHTPAQMIPVLGGKFPVSQVGRQEVMAYHEMEKKEMLNALDEYVQLCAKAGVNAQKLFIEADSIENGIITLISQQRIRRLVMGAAADNKYKRNMTELKSKKAIHVQLQAPDFCQIWFVCKGYLIYTRSRAKPTSPNREIGESNSFSSWTLTALSKSKPEEGLDRYKSKSAGDEGTRHNTDGWLTRGMSDGRFDEYKRLSRISMSGSACDSRSSEVVRVSPLLAVPPPKENHVGSSSSRLLEEKSMIDALYEQIYKLMEEAANSRKEAYAESMMRRKAEKECIEAIRKVKGTENLYHEEQKRRKELEEKLAKEKEEHEIIKNEHTKVSEQLQAVLLQKSSLERELEKSNLKLEELRGKIILGKHNTGQDDLESETEDVLSEPTVMHVSRFFADFTRLEIAEATDDFNPSRKIGEGGFGYTYKGLLRHTEVAIKVLNRDSSQGPQEFKQEVDILSKLRHPNIVTLIGVCSEVSALIYEYLSNGSLEDRLARKDDTPPLSWQTRIQIAAELCSVLIFLHSCQPKSIVHGDLKPANVLLDAHLACKLSDFGIARTISNDDGSMENTTKFYRTTPKGTFTYMDPEFVSTGELTPKSDVYSFGIILLRLLTGKPALRITREVQYALDKDNLNLVLDPSAGDWPFEKAKQLALLALRCCDMRRKHRPELVTDVWTVLGPMRVLC